MSESRKSKRAAHIVAGILSYDARVKSYIAILTKDGWSVDVICYHEKGKPQIETQDQVRIFRVSGKYQGKSVLLYLNAYRRFYSRAKKLLRRLHDEESYDMVHINNMPNFLVGMTTKLKPKPKVILDMHDIMSINYKTKFGGFPPAVKLTEMEERWSLKRADAVICADHGQQEALEELHNYNKAHVIMNLPNPEIFKWSDHSYKGGKFRFVYSGTIAHRHGVDRAVRALKDLPDHIVLRIVGDGDGVPYLKRVIKKSNLESRVELLPRVPVEEIPELLKDCHAGVIPTRKTEATEKVMMPVKFMEYCALGIPSVAALLSNFTRYVKSSDAVYFNSEIDSTMGKAMLEMIKSTERRSRVIANIQKNITKGKWESNVIKYNNITQ